MACSSAAFARLTAASACTRALFTTLNAQSPRALSSGACATPVKFSSSFRGVTVPSKPGRHAARRSGTRSMSVRAVKEGDKLPAGEFSYFDKDGNLQTISVEALTKGKTVVLFAVPGAFTPTCSQKHLPGFIEKADELKAKGVDTIACVSVNDAFVLKAWGDQVGTGDKVLLLADGSGKFTADLGVTLDLSDKGLGLRSRRYALLAEDGVVKTLNLEEGGQFTVSSAEDILKAL